MKFNVHFTFKGPGGTHELPNSGNPIEYANISALLVELAHNLPKPYGIELVGVRVDQIGETDESSR